jgi:hypothetical protein
MIVESNSFTEENKDLQYLESENCGLLIRVNQQLYSNSKHNL